MCGRRTFLRHVFRSIILFWQRGTPAGDTADNDVHEALAIANTNLSVNAADVVFYRTFCNAELVCDIWCAASFGEER